jgi:hypothetical protein
MMARRGLSKGALYFLYRCALAERWFTSPTRLEHPRPTPAQLQKLRERDLVFVRGGTTRLTAPGTLALLEAGIDLRSARAAEESWRAFASRRA